MSATEILSALDVEVLRSQGLLKAGPGPGSRRIHKRRLNSSSDEEYNDIPLETASQTAAALDAYALIPTALISFDTLLYVGFSKERAEELWSQWTNWPSVGFGREIDPDNGGLQITFIDFITARLDNFEDAFEDDDAKWNYCIEQTCGMSASIRNAIMDPVFKNIRLTSSCVAWVKDTIHMRYAGLEDIQRASMKRDMQLRRAQVRERGHGRSGSGSGSGGDPGKSSGQSGGEKSSQNRRSISGMQQQATPGISSTLWTQQVAIQATNVANHTTLFKGIDQARIHGLFDENGNIEALRKLLSNPPSDFSGDRALFYFTPDYRVAEYYAAYAKKRAKCESVVIVCLQIPNSAINNLNHPEIQRLYWPAPRWKELVWRCKTLKSIPKPLRTYGDALLVIGSTSKGAPKQFEKMSTWEEMSNACVLYVGDRGTRSNPAVQYVFSGGNEACDFLTEHGKFDVHPISKEVAQALVRRYT